MYLQKQRMIRMCLALLMLVTFSVNITDAQQLDADAEANREKMIMFRAYHKVSATAARALMLHLTDPTDTDALEQLVARSNNFIANYPTFEQADAVSYYLGKALVQLGDVDKGIATLEKLMKDTPSDRPATTRYEDNLNDSLTWNLHERGLLELGLAYDKQNAHDKADAIYKQLITHPEFGDGVQAWIARKLLESDAALRTGQVPASHDVWIGLSAPNFRMRYGEGWWQSLSLNRYEGQIVLLYYGAPDTQNLNLAQLHDKYKDQKFQIITANTDVSDTPTDMPTVEKGDAWIHYHDTHGKIVEMFQIRALPALFLIDSEGVVRKTQLDAAPLEKAVDELVKENLVTYADPRTQAVIAKVVEAHGGLEKLKAVDNIVKTYRTVVINSEGAVEGTSVSKSYLYRDKIRVERNINTGEGHGILFDGIDVYMIFLGGNYERMQDIDAMAMIENFKDIEFVEPIWLLPILAQNEIPIQYVGTEKVKGAPTAVLRIQQPSGTPRKIYISEETHYIVQLEYDNGHANTVRSIEQYEDVDGIKMSHYSLSRHQYVVETVVTELNINADIDPKLFDPNSVEKKEANIPKVKPDNLAENAEPKAEDIIAAIVAAHGGREKLQAVENMVRDYRLYQMRPNGTLETYGGGKAYLYPDKYRSDFYSVNDEKYTMLSDGTAIYMGAGLLFQRLPEDQAKLQMARDKDMAFREPIWLLKTLAQNKVPVEYVGIADVKDGTASVLRVKQPSGKPIKIFISDKTHYLVEIEVEGDKTVKIFGQFKDVDGIMLPHQSITRRAGSHHETHFSNVVINAEIDPALFEPK